MPDPHPSTGAFLRVGIDLVRVPEVRDSVRAHGDRYLERVYTEREIADCRTADGDVAPERLAARFAAKEATIKALRPAGTAVPWRTVEVRRDPDGWVELALSAQAAEHAAAAGLRHFALSLTHEGEYASAVVVAQPGA